MNITLSPEKLWGWYFQFGKEKEPSLGCHDCFKLVGNKLYRYKNGKIEPLPVDVLNWKEAVIIKIESKN